MITVTTNYNGATMPADNPTIESGYSGTYCGGVLVAQSRTINLWDEPAEAEPTAAEPEEKTSAEPIHNYTGNGWQGSKYDDSMTTKDIAAAIRKDLKSAYPGVKFSVRCKYASMCSEIIVSAVSGGIRKATTAATLEELEAMGGDPMEKHFVNGYMCNYFYNFALDRETTEEEKAAYLAEIPSEEFKAMQEGVKAIVNAYNYNDSDGMIDYCSVNFYEDIDFSGYEYIPGKAKGEPKKAESATAEPGKVCGVSVEIIDDTDTRDGTPLTVVKLSERVDREKYNEIAAYMKESGGYYSRFKGGFIFRSRPEFLEVSEGEEVQSEAEQPQDGYIDPSTVAEGDEITLTNIQQGQDRKAVFHCFTPSENSISVTMSNGLNVGVRKVYELGEVFRIKAVTHHTPKAEEPQGAVEKRFSLQDRKYIDTVPHSLIEEGDDLEIINLVSGEKTIGYVVKIEETDEDGATVLLNSPRFNNFAERIYIGGREAIIKRTPQPEEPQGESEKPQKINYIATVRAGANETNTAYELVNCEYFETLEGAKKYITDNKTALENWAGGYVANYYDGVVVYEDMEQPHQEEQTAQTGAAEPSSDGKSELIREAAEYYKRVKAESWAAYCTEIEGWEISDNKKQKIIDKAYKKYLPIITAEARHVSVMVAGPAKYNSRRLDHADEVLRSSAEFSTWFDGIRGGIKPKRTGNEERTEQLIRSIRDCISNKDNTKNLLDWEGLCRKYLESLAVLNQGEFVKWYEMADKCFKFRKSTKISKLYSKAKGGEQITAEKREIFSDENLTAYTDGGRVYLRFITPPAQQLKFAMKKRGYWWNAYRSEWSTYENRLDEEWIKSISTRYEKYI